MLMLTHPPVDLSLSNKIEDTLGDVARNYNRAEFARLKEGDVPVSNPLASSRLTPNHTGRNEPSES